MRLIDAEREIERYTRVFLCPTPDVHEFEKRNAIIIVNALKQMKTVESRTKGVWVGIDEEPHEEWECNNCGNIIITYLQDELEEHKYCHKCGAEMSAPWANMRGEE